MKLIKLSETHYIVVDDSEIKEGDFVADFRLDKRVIVSEWNEEDDVEGFFYDPKKISHSTRSLELVKDPLVTLGNSLGYKQIKPLSLSEVKELILDYSVEKMADFHCKEQDRLSNPNDYNSFIKGFKAHQELTKDKLFTIEDINKAIRDYSTLLLEAIKSINEPNPLTLPLVEDFTKVLLLPKTEWDILFVDGKLKLV